jgi:hypothetical protein
MVMVMGCMFLNVYQKSKMATTVGFGLYNKSIFLANKHDWTQTLHDWLLGGL